MTTGHRLGTTDTHVPRIGHQEVTKLDDSPRSGFIAPVLAASLTVGGLAGMVLGEQKIPWAIASGFGLGLAGAVVLAENSVREATGEMDVTLRKSTAELKVNQQARIEAQALASKLSAQIQNLVREQEENDHSLRVLMEEKSVLKQRLARVERLEIQNETLGRYAEELREALSILGEEKDGLENRAVLAERTVVQLNEIQADLEKELDEVPREYLTIIEAGKAENNTLQREIARLTGVIKEYSQPKKLQGASHGVGLANRVIETLLSWGYAVDAIRVEEHEGFIDLWLKPRAGGIEGLRTWTDNLYLALELVEEPTVSLNDGCLRLRVRHSKRQTKATEETRDWLPEVLLKGDRPNHLKVSGESESGKSTLVSNAIDIYQSELPGLKVILGDPLADTGDSDWGDFEPTYRDDEECFQSLQHWAETVQKRKDDPSLERPPTLLIMDEVDTLAADYNGGDLMVTKAIQKIWKQGRHVGVWLLLIGQSAYPSDLKLKLGDLRNAVSVYVGSNAPQGMKHSNLDNNRETQWLARYNQMKEQGKRYIAWIQPKQAAGFMAELPKPGAYSTSGDTDRILGLLEQGLSASEVVKEVYGLSPSRSKDYREAKAKVVSLGNIE